MDKFILNHTRQSAQLDALRNSFIEGEPAGCCAWRFTAIGGDLPPRLEAVERELREHGWLPLSLRVDLPGQAGSGACAKPPWAYRWP